MISHKSFGYKIKLTLHIRHSLNSRLKEGETMTFFSFLYESEESKRESSKNDWMKFKRRSSLNRDKAYEYIGNKLVKVQPEEDNTMYPVFYEHLNLDGIIEKIYGRNIFLQMEDVLTHLLVSKSTVSYRQGIMKDFEEYGCYKAFLNFRNSLKEVHQTIHYSQETKSMLQSDSYYLKAICLYSQAVLEWKNFYSQYDVTSEGLNRLKHLLIDYTEGEQFLALEKQAKDLKLQMEKITYQLEIGEKQMKVRLGKCSQNYTQVLAEKVQKLVAHDTSYLTNLSVGIEVNKLETQIIEILKREYEDLFQACHDFVQKNRKFIAGFIKDIEDEMMFYIGFLDYMNALKKKGFTFCYPQISEDKDMDIQGMYDLSLAVKKQSSNEVIDNDIKIERDEKGAFITGANQGGKTTFIRGLGQMAYFTALGLPVAAQSAVLPLYERIYTHFPEAENQYTNNGKLKEELIHLESMLESVHDKSLVLMNELFSSTTMKDGYEMGKRTIAKLTVVGATVFCVTHIMSLAQEDLGLVSLVAEINEDKGTYKISRSPVDGYAHTNSLIKKYHLSYEEVKECLTYGNQSLV